MRSGVLWPVWGFLGAFLRQSALLSARLTTVFNGSPVYPPVFQALNNLEILVPVGSENFALARREVSRSTTSGTLCVL